MNEVNTGKATGSEPRVLTFPSTDDAAAWRAGSALHVAYMLTNSDMSRLRGGYAYLEPGCSTRFSFEERNPGIPGTNHVGYLDEIYFILHGTAELRCGDSVLTAGPGQMAFLPRGNRYSLTNVGKDRLQVAWASVWFTPPR